jgi:hypothetical protein
MFFYLVNFFSSLQFKRIKLKLESSWRYPQELRPKVAFGLDNGVVTVTVLLSASLDIYYRVRTPALGTVYPPPSL